MCRTLLTHLVLCALLSYVQNQQVNIDWSTVTSNRLLNDNQDAAIFAFEYQRTPTKTRMIRLESLFVSANASNCPPARLQAHYMFECFERVRAEQRVGNNDTQSSNM
jgi:hypothetical protein